MAMGLPFHVAICMAQWLALSDLEVLQTIAICSKDLHDSALIAISWIVATSCFDNA